MKKTVFYSSVLSSILVLTACSSGSRIDYGDAQSVETTNIAFGSSDLQKITTDMVNGLLSSPAVADITQSRRPIVFVEGIKNKMKQFGAYRFCDIDFAIFYLYVKVKKMIAKS